MRPESFEIIDQIDRLGRIGGWWKGGFWECGETHPVSESRHVGTRSHPS